MTEAILSLLQSNLDIAILEATYLKKQYNSGLNKMEDIVHSLVHI